MATAPPATPPRAIPAPPPACPPTSPARKLSPLGLRPRAALRTKRRTCHSPGSASGTARRPPLARSCPASSEPTAASPVLPRAPVLARLRPSRASPACPRAASAEPRDVALADVARSPDRRSGGPGCLSHSDRRSRDGRGQPKRRGVKIRFSVRGACAPPGFRFAGTACHAPPLPRTRMHAPGVAVDAATVGLVDWMVSRHAQLRLVGSPTEPSEPSGVAALGHDIARRSHAPTPPGPTRCLRAARPAHRAHGPAIG